MTLVVDASIVVAALTDSGPDGEWATEELSGQFLASSHHMPIEVANILRRAAMAGDISADSAAITHGELLELRVEFFPYATLADRCWELRENVTVYDAAYVALAELLDARLATLDRRLSRAPGPRCDFLTPP